MQAGSPFTSRTARQLGGGKEGRREGRGGEAKEQGVRSSGKAPLIKERKKGRKKVARK